MWMLWIFYFILQVSDAVKKQQYEFDSLVLTVSLPAQLSVREVSPAATDDWFIIYFCDRNMDKMCFSVHFSTAFLLVACQKGSQVCKQHISHHSQQATASI